MIWFVNIKFYIQFVVLTEKKYVSKLYVPIFTDETRIIEIAIAFKIIVILFNFLFVLNTK